MHKMSFREFWLSVDVVCPSGLSGSTLAKMPLILWKSHLSSDT